VIKDYLIYIRGILSNVSPCQVAAIRREKRRIEWFAGARSVVRRGLRCKGEVDGVSSCPCILSFLNIRINGLFR